VASRSQKHAHSSESVTFESVLSPIIYNFESTAFPEEAKSVRTRL